MSKKSKKASKEKNKLAKQSKKRANRALYDSRRDAGTNSKSFRAKKRAKNGRSVGKGKHLVPNCGNIGCQKCHPSERKPQEFISVKEMLSTIKLKPDNKQIVGGSQTKKQRGGVKAAA